MIQYCNVDGHDMEYYMDSFQNYASGFPVLQSNVEYTANFQTNSTTISKSQIFYEIESNNSPTIDEFLGAFGDYYCKGIIVMIEDRNVVDQDSEDYLYDKSTILVFANAEDITLPEQIGDSVSGQLTQVEFVEQNQPLL